MSDKIKVLIVDDSALMRNLIGRIVEKEPDMEIFAKAMNGKFALTKLEAGLPDIIILDLEMPEMNGVEFLKKRKDLGLTVPVIILSSIARKGAEVTMEALNLGASDFVTKPSGSVSEDIHVVGDHLVSLIRAYARRGAHPVSVPVETHEVQKPAVHPPVEGAIWRPSGPLGICAIGISTGGPNALRQVFNEIDKNFPWPILVVQHMPPGFTAEFARSLDRTCPLEVKEAEDGDLVKPGRILIAPGDYHMEVERRSLASVVRIHQQEPVNGHRPSAGVLFKSVARAYGAAALGVIMTGMGRDGSVEIGEIKKAGGLTIGQDEGSCVVYGMPRVAWEMGNIHRQVGLAEMPGALNALGKEIGGS